MLCCVRCKAPDTNIQIMNSWILKGRFGGLFIYGFWPEDSRAEAR
jgi:hypothetical protein